MAVGGVKADGGAGGARSAGARAPPSLPSPAAASRCTHIQPSSVPPHAPRRTRPPVQTLFEHAAHVPGLPPLRCWLTPQLALGAAGRRGVPAVVQHQPLVVPVHMPRRSLPLAQPALAHALQIPGAAPARHWPAGHWTAVAASVVRGGAEVGCWGVLGGGMERAVAAVDGRGGGAGVGVAGSGTRLGVVGSRVGVGGGGVAGGEHA